MNSASGRAWGAACGVGDTAAGVVAVPAAPAEQELTARPTTIAAASATAPTSYQRILFIGRPASGATPRACRRSPTAPHRSVRSGRETSAPS